ncbi:uncharacterized protein M421DRAFT_212080 [Didymella exigua CBS 183.55]|uniref:Rhodopsin domain-containing protein n=1 Tax=Didymella exigua CBS 183.55 TaxID=1150837 RepID=A0A6A5RHP9_9PLEO|nr:uncharacterized protein M421DRAFT_212080 [Didymella exigua CBS 183.55]KAF1926628.1 hypothetical protein M421DRAFT_212080 [Didymella exigua CBS 183.55]
MDQYTPEELATLRGDDRGPLCKRIVVSFTVLSFISVCLRLYTRIRFYRIGWEDWTITASMIASIGTAICQILQVNAGNGKHAIFVPYPEGVSESLKYLYFSIITYNFSLTVTKISILLQYYRIFTLREMRIPVYIALALVSAWSIVTVFTAIFSCIPVDVFWKVTEQTAATCVNLVVLWYVIASVNIFTDLVVAVIPIRGIWNLQIPKRQKIALLGILTVGWIVCIVSVLRLHALYELNKHLDDASYYSAPTAYWSTVEANLAIVCASLPALKPLVSRIVPGFGTGHSSRGRGSTAVSGNKHRLHNIGSKSLQRSADEEEEKLTDASSASHAQSFASAPSESENHGRNIYVTKHFEQHVEDIHTGPMDSGK